MRSMEEASGGWGPFLLREKGVPLPPSGFFGEGVPPQPSPTVLWCVSQQGLVKLILTVEVHLSIQNHQQEQG